MQRALVIVMLGLAGVAPAAPARADNGPVIVIPSRPGFPVVINGRNANWAVVEGDWGLSRPGHGVITVIGGTPLAYGRRAPRRHYYPHSSASPDRGRNEIDPGPGRVLPEPAESFSRSWSTDSEPLPVSDPPADLPPRILNDSQMLSPPIIIAPQIRRPRP